MTYQELNDFCKIKGLQITQISSDIGCERTVLSQRIARNSNAEIDRATSQLLATAIHFELGVIRKRISLQKELKKKKILLDKHLQEQRNEAWVSKLEKDIEKYTLLNEEADYFGCEV